MASPAFIESQHLKADGRVGNSIFRLYKVSTFHDEYSACLSLPESKIFALMMQEKPETVVWMSSTDGGKIHPEALLWIIMNLFCLRSFFIYVSKFNEIRCTALFILYTQTCVSCREFILGVTTRLERNEKLDNINLKHFLGKFLSVFWKTLYYIESQQNLFELFKAFLILYFLTDFLLYWMPFMNMKTFRKLSDCFLCCTKFFGYSKGMWKSLYDDRKNEAKGSEAHELLLNSHFKLKVMNIFDSGI